MYATIHLSKDHHSCPEHNIHIFESYDDAFKYIYKEYVDLFYTYRDPEEDVDFLSTDHVKKYVYENFLDIVLLYSDYDCYSFQIVKVQGNEFSFVGCLNCEHKKKVIEFKDLASMFVHS